VLFRSGLILLSTLFITANRFVLNQETLALQSQYVITAVSLGQSIINEAKDKSFDKITKTGSINSPNLLTAPSSLGAESDEQFSLPDTISNFTYMSSRTYDDIDDYDGYCRTVNTVNAENYLVKAEIIYVSATCPDSISTVRTFCKRMTVTVTSPYISIPIILSYSFTY
jgi:hypothetical protein